jgi:hypothetical protein
MIKQQEKEEKDHRSLEPADEVLESGGGKYQKEIDGPIAGGAFVTGTGGTNMYSQGTKLAW